MKIFDNCAEATKSCISNNYFAVAHLYSDEKTKDIHTHNCHELYYSISGAKQFLIGSQFYQVEPGDVFFINPFESHCLTHVEGSIHERILILISPDYLKSISTTATDLNTCFGSHTARGSHRIHLSSEEQKRFLFYVDNLKSCENYGSDIMERSLFALIMVYLTKRYLNFMYHGQHLPIWHHMDTDSRIQANGIISYIDQHLLEPLDLEQIADEFHFSTSYICRIFKASTGTTIAKYISSRRISQAKMLLTKGYNVSDAAAKCGFEDYSNFYKAFTKNCGISPKKYVQFSTRRELTES